MLSAIARTTKQAGRQELARRTHGLVTGTTTGAGNTLTAVDSGNAGMGDRYFDHWWLLLGGGTYTGHYRPIDTYTSSTGTFAWLRALAGASGASVAYELYKFNPSWYTQALREAVHLVGGLVRRPCTYYLTGVHPVTGSGTRSNAPARRVYALPSHIQTIESVERADLACYEMSDTFTRSDAAGTPGDRWVAQGSATWGISSGRLYSSSDTDGDQVHVTAALVNGWLRAELAGTMESSSAYRTPCIKFRELDTDNYLYVRLIKNGSGVEQVQLHKVEGGTDSKATAALDAATVALTDGYLHEVTVRFVDRRIDVWVDGVQYIEHTLTTGEREFLGEDYGNFGFRLDKAGSPGTDARIDNLAAYHITPTSSLLSNWNYDRPFLELEAPIAESHPLTVRGMAPLTQPVQDTTPEVIASDTTAVLEISIPTDGSTDPEWELLMAYAEAALYRIASNVGNLPLVADRDEMKLQANRAFEFAEAMSRRLIGSHRPIRLRGPRW